MVVVRLEPERTRAAARPLGLGAATASSPTRRSAPTPAARSRSTASRASPPAEPSPALVCPCHYSTFDPATGGNVTFGPAGRRAAAAAAVGRLRGRAARRRRLLRAGRPRLLGRADAKADGMIRRTVRFLDQRSGAAPLLRKTLRYTFPDHWSFLLGEVALYAFIVLVATGIYLTFFFEPSTDKVVYHGVYRPLQGMEVEQGLRLGDADLLRSQGRAADPPDPPLGGQRLRRRDRPPRHPHLLHRRLPQAARADLHDRRPDAVHGAARGLPRLLAGRRPALRHGARDRLRRRALDPLRRRQPGAADLGAPVPRRPGLLVADVHRPRPHLPGPDRRACSPPTWRWSPRATTPSSAASASTASAR